MKFNTPSNPDEAIDMALDMMEEEGASFFLVVTRDHETKVMQMVQNTPEMDAMDVIAHLLEGIVEGAESMKQHMTRSIMDVIRGHGKRTRRGRHNQKDIDELLKMFKIKPTKQEEDE